MDPMYAIVSRQIEGFKVLLKEVDVSHLKQLAALGTIQHSTLKCRNISSQWCRLVWLPPTGRGP